MIKYIKKIIHQYIHCKKVDKSINDSMIKNEKVLELIRDDADYDGMGNYGRFPPMEKIVNKRKLHDNELKR
jgi:hypothetical protein